MSKPNGIKDRTTLSQKEQKLRHCSSVLPTFLKWFKKDSNSHEIINSTQSTCTLGSKFSPSSSSSCDSIISTSTTGFAYIKPSNYKPDERNLFIDNEFETDIIFSRHMKNQREENNLTLRTKYHLYDADTLKSNNLTVKSSATKYLDSSLPNIKYKFANDRRSYRRISCHRRTVSDSSKEKRSGAYVHVKGKRKAPQPPLPSQSLINNIENQNNDKFKESFTSKVFYTKNITTLSSPGSTLNKKKRKAPPPPVLSISKSNAVVTTDDNSSQNFFSENDIKAILGTTNINNYNNCHSNTNPTMNNLSISANPNDDITNDTSKLSDTQKQTIIEKVIQAHNSGNILNNSTNDVKQMNSLLSSPSQISPKPWYKRPISYNRESSIPFKREIVLKTMEKRKQKQREKESIDKSINALPEVGYSRSSIFDAAGHKFGFFSRYKESSNTNSDETKSKDKDKRRSGIGIPNISELDREAAAIVNEELQAQARAREKNFFKSPFSIKTDQLILQQQMFAPENCINNDNGTGKTSLPINIEEEKPSSTKDLISKFESDSNVTKISLNTSFLGRTDLFCNNNKNSLVSVESSSFQSTSPFVYNNSNTPEKNEVLKQNNNQVLKKVKEEESEIIENNENPMSKLSWNCPVCTLENPSWRIMCEVCEKLRPFETESKFKKIHKSAEKLKDPSHKLEIPKTSELLENNYDWDNKTEKVMKYFKPRQSMNVLTKSSSESIVGKKQQHINRKSQSPSQLPIGSPKFNAKNRFHNIETNILEENSNSRSSEMNNSISSSLEDKDDENIKKPFIQSSAIVTTVTPVFYASSKNIEKDVGSENIENDIKSNENNNSKIDLKEVRTARILKFTPKQNYNEQSSDKDVLLNDANFLEMEKKRLHEKIRAMNAKALTEKYPVLQQTTNNTPIPLDKDQEITLNQNVSQGAIKKILPQDRPIQDTNKQTTVAVQRNVIKSSQINNNNNNSISMYAASLKPKKVSASAQTSNLIKKDTEIENKEMKSSKSSLLENDVLSSKKNVIQKDFVMENDDKNYFFKSKLHYMLAANETNRTNTIALNKIMRNLELAIAEGDDELAAKIAMDLAKMKVSLQVTKTGHKKQTMNENRNNQIIKVNVLLELEGKNTKQRSMQLEIEPHISIMELKQKIWKNFNIPINEQKLFINNEIIDDNFKTLEQFNILDKNFTNQDIKVIHVKAFNVSNKKIIPKKAVCEELDEFIGDIENENEDNDSVSKKELQHDNGIAGATALTLDNTPNFTIKTWECPLCTLINSIDCKTCSACSKARPQKFNTNTTEISDNQILSSYTGAVLKRIPENKNDLNKLSNNVNRKSTEIFNIIDESTTKVLSTQIDNMNQIIALHFSSPNITKCKYRGVDNFNPNRKSIDQQQNVPLSTTSVASIIKETKDSQLTTISATNIPNASSSSTFPSSSTYNSVSIEQKSTSILETKTNNHYLELLDLENTDTVLNLNTFECPICFVEYEPGEGIVLRDCLHTFCRECLINTIQYSDEAEVKCPYIDVEYSCTSVLQEREIRAIVNKDIYESHLAKSVRVAEHQIENTFHCRTPNCRGWCIYEDNVNQFKCPVCRITNCLTCRVIHDGLSCKQYQDRLNSDCDSNLEARRTKEMLKEMVEKGEAMNCPTCQVILMKKWGCDWLKCSMCKTEICWVTRGPRWGPGGKNDTSAGCKCGVDGKKCHPKCNYCH